MKKDFMNFKYFTLSLSLFSSFVLAAPSEQDLRNCEHEGRNFGSGKGPESISASCYIHFSASAYPQAVKKSLDEKWKITGHRNIVYVEKKVNNVYVKTLISGSNTQLDDVIAVAIDDVNNEVAVLERSGDVLFFSSIVTGNVAPLRTIRTKELTGAVDLVIDIKNSEVILANAKTKNILFYSRLANFFGREEKRNLTLTKRIDGFPMGDDSLAISPTNQELFALDSANSQVIIYKLAAKMDTRPARVVKIPNASINNLAKVEYLAGTDELSLWDKSGKQFKVPRISIK
jgi:hypothetical protein